MRKLHRLDPPACLAIYQSGVDKWEDVTLSHKYDIWVELDKMQHNRCAYCESEIKTGLGNSSHIEHFRQRFPHIEGTFEWDNLFGSCNREDSCGKFKDKPPIDPNQNIIKMDIEDPDDFLHFLPDGNVVPRDNLNPSDQIKATETIRLFNLNGSLRQIRQTSLEGYLYTVETFIEIAQKYDAEEWFPLYEEELAETNELAFSTAIKHTLELVIS